MKRGADDLLPVSPSNFDTLVLVRDTSRALAGRVNVEAGTASRIDANHGILNRTETLSTRRVESSRNSRAYVGRGRPVIR